MSGGLGLLATLKRKIIESKAEVEKWKKTVEEASWKTKEVLEAKSRDEIEVSGLRKKRENCEEDITKSKIEAVGLLHQIESVEREMEELARSKRAQEEKNFKEEGKLKRMELYLRERKGQLLKMSDDQNQVRARMAKMDGMLASTLAKAEAIEEAGEELESELSSIGVQLQSIERSGDSVVKQQEFDLKMKKVLVQCRQYEASARKAMSSVARLEGEVSRLEGVLMGVRTNTVQIEQEMEEAVQGLRNM